MLSWVKESDFLNFSGFLYVTHNRIEFAAQHKLKNHVCEAAAQEQPLSPDILRRGISLASDCGGGRFFQVISSNLYICSDGYSHMTGMQGLTSPPSPPLCTPFKPVPYLPLVCVSVFDGPWLGERQSLINWWVWLPGLCWGCKPSAFHSNRQP